MWRQLLPRLADSEDSRSLLEGAELKKPYKNHPNIPSTSCLGAVWVPCLETKGRPGARRVAGPAR